MRTKDEYRLMTGAQLAQECLELDRALDSAADSDDPYDDTFDCFCTELGRLLDVCKEKGIDPYSGEKVEA